MNARLMGVKPTGNGRRESYAHVPMPRMTNTYMLGGDKDPKEIVASIKRGPVCHQLRRRPGRHHQRQVRLQRQRGLLGGERQDPVPGEGRHHRRQRPESLKKASRMIGNDMRWTAASAPAARKARACRWAWASRRCASKA
jgi:TldD protein